MKTLCLHEFARRYSRTHIESMLTEAGTTWSYWQRIKCHRQRPSVDLARKLVKASGGELDFDSLLFAKEQKRGTGAAPIDPLTSAKGE